jgi:hypothetical protein
MLVRAIISLAIFILLLETSFFLYTLGKTNLATFVFKKTLV